MQVVPLLPEIREPELVGGVRVRKVSPKLRHATVQLNIALLLRRLAPPGKVGTEWRFSLNEGIDELVPDVAFASRERLLPLTAEEREQPPFAPDIAVEVWSTGDKRAVLERKIRLYLAHGCVLVLDANPTDKTIDAHTCDGAAQRFVQSDRFHISAVPWLRFDAAEAFAGVGEL